MTDRRPDVDAYLREHGNRYTPDALRAALIDAGHDPAAVDAAMAEWRARQTATTGERSRFRRFNWLFHAVVLVAVVALVAITSRDNIMRGVWPIVAILLAVVLLIGIAISGFIGGRLLLPRAGLAWALAVPLASALLIGGTCYAITGGFGVGNAPAPNGTATLHLEQPELIDVSGPVFCRAAEAGSDYSIHADQMSGNASATVGLDAHAGGPDLFIAISSGPAGSSQFSVGPRSTATIAAGSGPSQGRVDFDSLEGVGENGEPSAETAAGTFTWTCG